MLEIDTKVFKSVTSIGRTAVDSIVDDGFFTYGWLRTLEISKPPIKLDPFYLSAYNNGNLVAFAPCFRDIADQYFQYGPQVIPFMKKALKLCSRLHVGQEHVLLCYSPWCFRTKTFLDNRLEEKSLFNEIYKRIDSTCKKERILFSSFLFVSEFDNRLINNLMRLGYYKFEFWKPMLFLEIKWDSFEDYLKSLKGTHRHNVRREIKNCVANGIKIEQVHDFSHYSGIFSDLSYNLSLKYNKWAPKLEPSFYKFLSSTALENTVVFLAKKGEEVVGFSIFIRKAKTLDAFLGGFNYDLRSKDDFTYFNLVYYEPIKLAIKEGIKKIYYRWGSESAKYNRGCQQEKIFSFTKCHNKLINSQIGNYLLLRQK